jgi:hypothetical protein
VSEGILVNANTTDCALAEYAAAFFLLGGSLKDAVNVCIRQLQDFQLATAIARVAEGGEDGPVLSDILNNTVVPKAFKEGNRWLASWAFWVLHRRDLAVRILVVGCCIWSPRICLCCSNIDAFSGCRSCSGTTAY